MTDERTVRVRRAVLFSLPDRGGVAALPSYRSAMPARRDVGRQKKYAWVVAPDGHVRSFPIRAGCTHRVVDYKANAVSKGFDRGQYPWFIRAEVQHEGWVKLEDAYREDPRGIMSRTEDNGNPAGFNRYMEWVAAREQRRTAYGMIEGERDDGRKYKRRVPKAYPIERLPAVAYKRLKGLTDDAFELPEIDDKALDLGVDGAGDKQQKRGR